MPLSNIVVNLKDDPDYSDLKQLLKNIIDQLDELLFITRYGFNHNLFLDFSETNTPSIVVNLLSDRYLNGLTLNNLSVIITPELFDKIDVDYIIDKKIRIKVLATENNCKKLKQHKSYNNLVDIIFSVTNNCNLKDIYDVFSKYLFNSIDFLLSDTDDLNLFIKNLIELANYYIEENSDVRIVCIDNLLKNYLMVRSSKDLVLQNASLVVLINGGILKAENYLYSRNKIHFSDHWNIYKDKLIDIILTKEYYQYFSNSSLNRLDVEANNAIDYFIKKGDTDRYRKHEQAPLVLFYEYYKEYLDRFI